MSCSSSISPNNSSTISSTVTIPESEFYETLGGMIAYTTGEIPAKGERIDVSSFSMKIEKVSATKIEQIILTKTEVN